MSKAAKKDKKKAGVKPKKTASKTNKSKVKGAKGSKSSKGKGGKGSKGKGSKTSVKSSASLKGSKTPSSTSVKSAKVVPPATPETLAKNKDLLDKICNLMANLKADQVTRSSKDDLDKIQLLIKNISFRDGGELGRVREVPLTEKQQAVIKMISDVGCEDIDTMAMTVTDKNEATTGKSITAGEPKVNYPYEKLEFVPTK